MKYLFEILTKEEKSQLIEYLIKETAADRMYAEGLVHGIGLTVMIALITMLLIYFLKTKKEKQKGEWLWNL